MENRARKSLTTWVLVSLTSVYAIAFYYLAIQTKTCDIVDAAISSNWFHGFWDKFLACRQINELGDTLGGAFAPVAFLWLAGTVFIQSQELAAQRQELDETQSVMREQLEVARQQVEETKASTALFKKQTEILEREQSARDQAQADSEFDQMVENFLDYIAGEEGFGFEASEWERRLAPGLMWNSDSDEALIFVQKHYYVIFSSARSKDLAVLAKSACDKITESASHLSNKYLEIDESSWDAKKFIKICNQIEQISEKTIYLSLRHKILAERYRLQPLLISLRKLESALISYQDTAKQRKKAVTQT